MSKIFKAEGGTEHRSIGHRAFLNAVLATGNATHEETNEQILLADNNRLPASCKGDVLLKEVLYVTDISTNLLSVTRIVKHGHTVLFNDKGCRIYDTNWDLMATTSLVNNMYWLDQPEKRANCTRSVSGSALWHRRLGHLNQWSMRQLRDGSATGLTFSNVDSTTCTTCGSRAHEPLQLVHSDICDPMEEQSIRGSQYFFTLIDDYNRKVFVYFLISKNEATTTFKVFRSMIE
ncbi:hypothetical protein PR048_013201 [Dryococelus australis]|uniref:Integrase catalytic domain-containing protein n=1 Tax=Dryococelus australis TaxID=614101 RepID=A0ABQ9HRZ1_9NEOP|nr:hypothetical protein PR048_013201 [Dryococelus australis]